MLLLTAATIAPLAGAATGVLFARRPALARALGAASAAAALAACVIAFWDYHPVEDNLPSLMTTEPSRTLLPAWNVVYEPAADGVSMTLALLITALTLAVVSFPHRQRARTEPWMLVGCSASLLALFASDAAVFLIGMDSALVALLVATARSGEIDPTDTRRAVAYLAVASAPIWLALLTLHWLGHGAGFRLTDLLPASMAASPTLRSRLGAAFLIGLAARIPLVPVHRWSVDLVSRGSPLLSALLYPMTSYLAAYGIFRFAVPLFPDATASLGPAAAVLAAAGLLHLGMLAYTDPDPSSLFAHACTALCSLMALGLLSFTRPGINGAILLMVSQGLVMAALFMMLAALTARGHWSLATVVVDMPRLTTMAAVAILALSGLPGTSGFVAQIMTLAGAFNAYPGSTIAGALGLAPITVGLIALQRRATDALRSPSVGPHPSGRLRSGESIPIVAILIVVVLLGVAPRLLLERVNPVVDRYCEEIEHRRALVRSLDTPVRAVEDPFHVEETPVDPTKRRAR